MDNPRLTPTSRAGLLDGLEADSFDIAVVGGGVTGAGIAREAAGRGLRVALVEADDFAAGTSGRSSKLIHGGLRYLAAGEVDLVRKTVTERTAVHAMAPHLAEPAWMVVPARNRVAAAKFRVGIATYERLGSVDGEDRHQLWRQDEMSKQSMGITRRRTVGLAQPSPDLQTWSHESDDRARRWDHDGSCSRVRCRR